MYGNAFGTNQPQAQPQQAPTDAGGMTDGQSGPGVQSMPVSAPGAAPSGPQIGAAMGGAAPAQAAPQQQMPNGALTLPGKTPQQSMMLYSMLGPDGYARVLTQWGAPTDATRMAMAAGLPVGQANADALFHANYVAPNQGTPGTIARDPRTNQPMYYSPNVPANGQPAFDATGRIIGMAGMPGSNELISQDAAARTGGEGSQLPFTEGKDVNGNPLPVMSRTQAATGNVPLPLRNNNPGAVSPGGSVAQYPTMQAGLQAMDSNLADYAKDPNVKTIGDAITKWVGSPPNAPAYISDVTARLGVKANTPIDLTNPAQRQALSTAIMLHENGPGSVFAGRSQGAPAQGNGAVYAAPPLGAVANANTSQQASADSMKASYGKLQAINSSANGALDALQKMQTLAASKNSAMTAGALGTMIAPTVSPEAAEYEKQRANVITLLANQNGTNGSDAGRALTGESVPDYGKPKAAIQDGLQTQINQLRAQQLKANVLTPVYQSGDSKAYTTLENGFDQAIKPSMMPVLSLSGDAQRAAVQAAIKANPALRTNFEWAFNNGLLK
jgi:hypothetical protein